MGQTKPTHTYTCAGLFYCSHWLVDAVDELADMLKVPRHLRGQHHVDDGLPQCSELIPEEHEEDKEGFGSVLFACCRA